jgi:hypothetical protein
MYPDGETDPGLLQKRVEHEEEKRRGIVEGLKEVRAVVVAEEKSGAWVANAGKAQLSMFQSKMNNREKSSVIEKELKQL